MTALIPLVLCFALGILLRQTKRLPENASAVLSAIILNIALPAVIIRHIHDLHMNGSLIYATLMPWLHIALAALILIPLARCFSWSQDTLKGLLLVVGLGNTSFVGFPMIEAFYGKAALGTGVIVDQTGSFFVMSTIGLWIATTRSRATAHDQKQNMISYPEDEKISVSKRETVNSQTLFSFHYLKHSHLVRMLSFPPFFSLIIALLLRPIVFPDWLIFTLTRLGDLLPPLAFLLVGAQVSFKLKKIDRLPLAIGLFLKLILLPAALSGIYYWIVPENALAPNTRTVILFESAMPSMITAGILAIEHKLRPSLAALMVSGSIILSFFTLPLWYFILSRFA